MSDRIRTTSSLQVGDQIVVIPQGRQLGHAMTVTRIYTDQSKAAHNSRTVVAHIRPGGYSITFDDMHLAERIYTVTKELP